MMERHYKKSIMKRVLVFIIMISVIFLIYPPPVYIMSPGETKSTNLIITNTTNDKLSQQQDDQFYYTTALLTPTGWFGVLASIFKPNQALVSKKQLLNGRSLDEYKVQANIAMKTSMYEATAAAYNYLNIPYSEVGNEVIPDDKTKMVYFETSNVGGTSAGLIVSLSIIDALQENIINTSHRIAATGTISRDGKIGIIGSLEQKVVSVSDANIDLFLVPYEQVYQAQKKAESINSTLAIAGVSTLEEAIVTINNFSKSK